VNYEGIDEKPKSTYKRPFVNESYDSPTKSKSNIRTGTRPNGSMGGSNGKDLYYNSDSKRNFNPDNYPPIRMSREERELKYGDGSSNKKLTKTESNFGSASKSRFEKTTSQNQSQRKMDFASPERDIVTTREDLDNKRIYTTISRSPVKPYKEIIITSTIEDNFEESRYKNDLNEREKRERPEAYSYNRPERSRDRRRSPLKDSSDKYERYERSPVKTVKEEEYRESQYGSTKKNVYTSYY